MRDIVWTVIVIWVVWKIYAAFTSRSKSDNNHSGNFQKRKEGEVTIDKNISSKNRHFNDDEYVDYEEVK
ncbi:MAG: hypothetical protein V4565_00910 [Bacteroidota bacterium]